MSKKETEICEMDFEMDLMSLFACALIYVMTTNFCLKARSEIMDFRGLV